MKKYLLLFLSTVLILAWSCNDDNEDAISMEYKETNCENPWTAAPGSEDYINVVRSHLEENDITVYSIFIESFDLDPSETCQACNCLTGRKIVISTPDTDKGKAEALGFTLQ